MGFFLIFFSIYTGMHALVWAQACRQLALSGTASRLAFLLTMLLAMTPLLTRFVPEEWPKEVVIAIWWAAFLWFALVCYLFWLQTGSLILETAARFLRPALLPALRSPAAFLTVCALALATVTYGLFEATSVRTLRLDMTSPLLKHDLRAVFVSDIHLGAMFPTGRLKSLARLIQDQKPDLILYGGDIINDHPEWLAPEADILRAIPAPLGSYGIFGNHERYTGDNVCQDFFQMAGINLLRGQVAELPAEGLQIAGFDDPARVSSNDHFTRRALELMAPNLKPGLFTILLNHRPSEWPAEALAHNIDLQLSGHTHGGQFFPFNLIIRLMFPLSHGVFTQNNHVLAVSRGAGYWGPPIRVLAPPDIIVINLKASKAQ